jgi:hypothetical protein
MLEQVVENKHRIDLLNEQLEMNERNVRDLQITIKPLEEKFEATNGSIRGALAPAQTSALSLRRAERFEP